MKENDTEKIFQDALKKEWYTQSLSAVPIFLNGAAWSCATMKKNLGFGYKTYMVHYQNDFAEGSYWVEDLKRLWRIIKAKVSTNPLYLKQVKQKYENNFARLEKALKKKLDSGLTAMNDAELLTTFQEALILQIDSVGIAHIIEPIGVGLEKEFKIQLYKEIKNKKDFNKYYVLLAAPTKPSFVAQEEIELQAIAKMPARKRKEYLKQHLDKYFWLQNSYLGPQKLKLDFFIRRLKTIEIPIRQDIIRIKHGLIQKLNLSTKSKKMIEMIDFTTLWQDERKVNILKAISHLGQVIKEIGQRVKLAPNLPYYLTVSDVFNLHSLKDLKSSGPSLKSRKRGVWFLVQNKREFTASGNLYRRIKEFQKKLVRKESQKELELHGSIANTGTAIGRVAICKDVFSLDKVKRGDILVTSMTRPEFMPALKKVSAIITDEGGITCHAAIISRELGIPCVIGTKIATQVLKDGMWVEVRANHGIIRILE